MSRRAVFLDRDGTINVEVDYLSNPDDLVLVPGAAQAIAALNRAEFEVVIITNQSGIARGMLDETRLTEIHQRLEELLAPENAHIDAIYFCPHHPTIGDQAYRRTCECRKPLPGMLRTAAEERDLDLARSWVVGDSLRDLQAGAEIGVRGILVETGKGTVQRERLHEIESPAPSLCADLPAAVELILAADS